MKKIIFTIILVLAASLFPKYSYAQLPSGDQLEKINEKVDELKDKVASKVAQLNLVEKRGIVGTITKISNNQIVLNDLDDNSRIVDIDELTKFSSEDDNTFNNISDLKNGMQLSVIGIYNKDSQRLLARFVNQISIPVFISGVISDVNQTDFSIVVSTEDGEKHIIDVERITKTFSYTNADLQTSGFSKISAGQNVIVSGFINTKDKKRITASRLIYFPDVPKDPNVKVEIPTSVPSTPTPTPISK